MIDLTKKILPSSIEVEGRFYKVHTDFQYWLNFALKRKKGEIKTYYDSDFLYIEEKPKDRIKGFEKLVEFCDIKNELPREIGFNNENILIDFEIDSDLIYSAFFEKYNIDLLNPKLNLHWYKFNALLNGLHDTRLNEIQSYRCFDENDKTSYEKLMIQMKRAWEIEKPLTEKEKADLERFDSLFV